MCTHSPHRLQPFFLYMRHANKKTVLVNSPPEEEKTRLVKLLTEIKEIEDKILNLDC
jgi:hypothetical protein